MKTLHSNNNFDFLIITTLPPSGLLCDLLRFPEQIKICNPKPKFSWIVNDSSNNIFSNNIVVSSGHSLALSDDLANFADTGGRALSHFGNGLPNLLNRHHNPIWAALANDDLYAMIIVDGDHLPADLIKTILKVKGVDKTIVVSDIIHISGLAPGIHTLAEEEVVLEENGKVWKPELNCLAGSSVMMPKGGYCFAPTHQLQDNSPTENVVAMYETVQKYGKYNL